MSEFAILCSVLLGITSAYQLIQICCYAFSLRQRSPKITDDQMLPRFAVVMPLRGADPFLERAIHRVLDQDYPEFELHLVIDHIDDPALQIVEKAISKRNAENVHISFLNERLETCSLLCNAVRQFSSELDESIELILVCAADVVLPPNWLRTAAATMQDPSIGATLGNRWYMPKNGRFGSLVRYVWNTAATVSMWRFQGPWSGAMALRVSDIHRLNLTDEWARSATEDMCLAEPLRTAGLKLQHVPELLAINREEISLASNFTFLKRQALFAYLHHPNGFRMTTEAIPLSAATLLNAALLLFGIGMGDTHAATLAGLSLAISGVALGAGVILMEWCVRQIMKGRGEETTPITISSILLFPLANIVCQIQYLFAAPAAIMCRKLVWRGITYEIYGRGKGLRMVEYKPYRPPTVTQGELASI